MINVCSTRILLSMVNKEECKHRVVFLRRMHRTARIHWTWCHRKKGWSSICYACDKQTPNLSLSWTGCKI